MGQKLCKPHENKHAGTIFRCEEDCDENVVCDNCCIRVNKKRICNMCNARLNFKKGTEESKVRKSGGSDGMMDLKAGPSAGKARGVS